MENVKPSSSNVAFKWALIYLGASIIFTYAIQLSGMDVNSPVKYLNYLIFIAFMLLAQKEYRDKLGGFMTFGEGYISGIMYSVFSGLFSAVFVFVYLTFLSPQVYEQAMVTAQAQLQDKGMSADQIETAMNISRKYGVLIGSVVTVIALIIFGAIIALIGAAIFKKVRTLADIEKNSDSYTDPAV